MGCTRDFTSVASMLSANATLEALSLLQRDLTATDLKHIESALQTNTTLISFDYDKQIVDVPVAGILAESIERLLKRNEAIAANARSDTKPARWG